MSQTIAVDFEHRANAGVLRYLEQIYQGFNPLNLPPSISPDDVASPYERLGTHPEYVTRLWNKVTTDLPERCAWVVYGCPVLVHPASGILFGMASGTSNMLRLPEPEYRLAIEQGARTTWTYNDAWMKGLGPEHDTVLNLADWGPGWVFGDGKGEWSQWCLAAYQNAASGTGW